MPSRRDLLKAAGAAAATASSIGLGLRQASAQAPRSQIDGVLRQGVEAGDAAGVVAMAATAWYGLSLDTDVKWASQRRQLRHAGDLALKGTQSIGRRQRHQ